MHILSFIRHFSKNMVNECSYLPAASAAALDQELFSKYRYSVDQLMELAGLSVAIAIARVYPPQQYRKPLVICGPGNNGGDGLVAARHLTLFGYKPAIYYPKRPQNELYERLLAQSTHFGVNVLDSVPSDENVANDYAIIVDALFGFSFKPPVRETMQPALNLMINSEIPICSVDVPSGWDVDAGPPPEEKYVKPALLISLSAPKPCAERRYIGTARHFLGGRFLPPSIIADFNLTLPLYPEQEEVVELK